MVPMQTPWALEQSVVWSGHQKHLPAHYGLPVATGESVHDVVIRFIGVE